MTTNNSIYICGPVSGTDNYVERFAKVEKELLLSYDKVYNPVRFLHNKFDHPEKVEWSELMLFAIGDCLLYCTHIYLMSGWEKSHGARIEQLWADKLNLIEIYEVEKNV